VQLLKRRMEVKAEFTLPVSECVCHMSFPH
jgi:hypothetical protein